MSVSANLVR